MLNRIALMGRCTADPELRRTNNGTAVASVTLACERDFAPKDGSEKETDFVPVVAWRQTGEFLSKYFSRGRMVIVSGRLQLRKYTDKEGNKRTAAEIVADNVYFGDSKKDSEGTASTSYRSPGYTAPDPGYTAPAPASDFAMLEDEDAQLPF